jgi:hypothetical protein
MSAFPPLPENSKHQARFDPPRADFVSTPLMNCLLPATRAQICVFSFHQGSALKPSLRQSDPYFLISQVPRSISHGLAFGSEPLKVLGAHWDPLPADCLIVDKLRMAGPVPGGVKFSMIAKSPDAGGRHFVDGLPTKAPLRLRRRALSLMSPS